MNTADFIRKVRELTDALERFYITRSRLCAVTLHSGDGICVAYDRSDRSSEKLHGQMHDAFPEDVVIISYEPINSAYTGFAPCSEETLADPQALREAVRRYKDTLYSSSGVKYFSDITDKSIHVLYTCRGVIAGSTSLEKLEDSVFRTEELIRTAGELARIRNDAIVSAGNDAHLTAEKLRAMEKGKAYLKERKG